VAEHGEDDEVSRKIRAVRTLEQLGAEVLVLSADVADVAQMERVVDRARGRFGELHGVIHAAGVAGGGIIQLKEHGVAARVLAPKVRGTLVLAHVLGKTRVDFCVLCSSLASIYGGFGQVDYCGANAFLDAFPCSRTPEAWQRVLTVNWDTWREVG